MASVPALIPFSAAISFIVLALVTILWIAVIREHHVRFSTAANKTKISATPAGAPAVTAVSNAGDELYTVRMFVMAVSFFQILVIGLAPDLNMSSRGFCPGTAILSNVLYMFAQYSVFMFLFKKQRIVQIQNAMMDANQAKYSKVEIVLLVLMHIYLANQIIYNFLSKYSTSAENYNVCLSQDPLEVTAIFGVSTTIMMTCSFVLLRKFTQPLKQLLERSVQPGGDTPEASSRAEQLKRILTLNKQSCMLFVGANFTFIVACGFLTQPWPAPRYIFSIVPGILLVLDTFAGVVSVIMCSPHVWKFVPGYSYVFKNVGKDVTSNSTKAVEVGMRNSSQAGGNNIDSPRSGDNGQNTVGSKSQHESTVDAV